MVVLSRLQKRKGKNDGFFRCTLILLMGVAGLLSITTLVLSWLAIQRDDRRKARAGADALLPDPPNKGPHLRDRRGEKDVEEVQEVVASKNAPEKIAPEKGKKDVVEGSPDAETNSPPERGKSSGPGKSIVRLGPIPPGPAGADKSPRNSELYQPEQKGKRLLTYRRFGGRLNNQLFQFITSLQHAKVLKRTFVVPNEVRDVDWTGMFDVGFGIWDLDSLNAAYDIDWTTGLDPSFVNEMPPECLLKPQDSKALLKGGPKLWEDWDKMCPDVIDINGATGLLFCEQQHQFCGDYEAQMEAYRVYEHIKLAPSLFQNIPSKRPEFKDQGYDEMAIHARRAGEGGYDWELCVNGNSKTCRGHVSGPHQHEYCNVRTMKGNCAIWLDIDYQIKSKSFLKRRQDQYKFVLASDGTHDWHIDFKGQFIAANNKDWLLALERRVREDLDGDLSSMAVSALAQEKLKGQKDISRIVGNLDSITATLLDLFSLVDSKYLVGAYYSTLSLNACFFRGMDRIYDSNMCWMLMHPTSKYAVLPPTDESTNINTNRKDDDLLPAALMSDVEHAFVRSDDGNFMAIDRYLIRYPRKDVIGVVGDGLVPITIEVDGSGKETVRADFSCSYGDQHSPATVILMKGDQSYNEHYYVRGEKLKTPFSANGDRFRTMVILCEQLLYDRRLARHPPLVLHAPDGKFSLTIGSTFQRPNGDVFRGKGKDKPAENEITLVHCLNPVYGLTDPRWIIEYLEYHRAIGVSHVHIYNVNMHSPDVQSALQAFRDDGFITRHDWSDKASRGYTTHKTYEHAKWTAQTDCAMRSRGIFDYALFSDIDEVAVSRNASISGYSEGHLAAALKMCEEAKNKKGKIACSFNSNTVSSIYTKLNEEEELALKDKLLLERYNGVEAKPHCPSNCKCMGNRCSIISRKYHSGRQKYIANVKDLTVPPRPMWTHALARDYDEMDKIMEQLPDEVMHVRHYQGHWYKNGNLLDKMEEKKAPLPAMLMDTVRSAISRSQDKQRKFTKRTIYARAKDAAKSNGIEWIEPVERPAQYH